MKGVAHVLRIPKVPALNLGPENAYPNWELPWFSSVLRRNAGIELKWSKHRELPHSFENIIDKLSYIVGFTECR
jgi:hypothetical protein